MQPSGMNTNTMLFSRKICLICGQGPDEYNLGELYDIHVFAVHYLCVLTGSGLYPSGTGKSGLLGFHLGDMFAAYKNYIGIICQFCRQTGASLECVECKRRYHLPCGIKNGARVRMSGHYRSYCEICAEQVFNETNAPDLKELTCGICQEPANKDYLYWPKCCKPKENMFHFECLRLYAITAGYLVRCPLCMNKTKFRSGIRRFGVYIPNTDADWLVDEVDLAITYPLRCCAKVCIISSFDAMSTILIACFICDKKIAHLECTFIDIFVCPDCTKELWPNGEDIFVKSNRWCLGENFPWFYNLFKGISYSPNVQKVLNDIYENLGYKIIRKETVTWQDVVCWEGKVIIAAELKKYHCDFLRRMMNKKRDSMTGV